MQKGYSNFEKNINSYCDNNIGDYVLFPAFVNLWYEEYPVDKKDLVVVTSKIISDLLKKDVLIRVFQKDGIDCNSSHNFDIPQKDEFGNYIEIHNNGGFENGYAMYKIMPHKNLIEYGEIIKRKMKLLSGNCN